MNTEMTRTGMTGTVNTEMIGTGTTTVYSTLEIVWQNLTMVCILTRERNIWMQTFRQNPTIRHAIHV